MRSGCRDAEAAFKSEQTSTLSQSPGSRPTNSTRRAWSSPAPSISRDANPRRDQRSFPRSIRLRFFPAAIHAGLGRKAEALDGLERASRERAYWLISIQVNPWFDELRQEPRFVELERSLGFQAYRLRISR
jgi:hypothetical protein